MASFARSRLVSHERGKRLIFRECARTYSIFCIDPAVPQEDKRIFVQIFIVHSVGGTHGIALRKSLV
jgi:hypothetical protein